MEKVGLSHNITGTKHDDTQKENKVINRVGLNKPIISQIEIESQL